MWYALTGHRPESQWAVVEGEDLRVETAGQWTRGACVVDRRDRKSAEDGGGVGDGDEDGDGEGEDVPGDAGGWLSPARGNRVRRCVGTPGEAVLAPFMLDTIFR